MAWNFGSLKNALGDWLGLPATDTRRLPDSVRGNIINMRHREIARRWNLRENVATEAYTIATPGEYQLDLPGDYGTTQEVSYDDPITGDQYLLAGITVSEFGEFYTDLDDSNTWGAPIHWSIDGPYLVIGPPPVVIGGEVTMRYWAIPADLTASEDTSSITTLCGDALLYLALCDASAYILEEQRSALFLQRGMELLDQFFSQDARKIYEGRRPVSREP